jgi:hypothetical protein
MDAVMSMIINCFAYRIINNHAHNCIHPSKNHVTEAGI